METILRFNLIRISEKRREENIDISNQIKEQRIKINSKK